MGQAVSQSNLELTYHVQKVKLGHGSFGTVWRGIDRRTNNTVAIKQVDKAAMPRRGVNRNDVDREISMMRACVHENLLRLHDTFEDNSSIYLALEYCDGGDFGDKVKERGMDVQETEVAEWMRQICSAIAVLHTRGICHRDIKPDNFMVAGSSKLKLSDFGLAIYAPRGKLLTEKCGTPAFMSPEQHRLPRQSRGYSLPVDVWAAGVSMYMLMLGGRHPFLDSRGSLSIDRLDKGALDFAQKGFFGFGTGPDGLRFSETARNLCKRMVDRHPGQRITAATALRSPWLHQGTNCVGPAAPPPQRTALASEAGQGGSSENLNLMEPSAWHQKLIGAIGPVVKEFTIFDMTPAQSAPEKASPPAGHTTEGPLQSMQTRTREPPPLLRGDPTEASAIAPPSPGRSEESAKQDQWATHDFREDSHVASEVLARNQQAALEQLQSEVTTLKSELESVRQSQDASQTAAKARENTEDSKDALARNLREEISKLQEEVLKRDAQIAQQEGELAWRDAEIARQKAIIERQATEITQKSDELDFTRNKGREVQQVCADTPQTVQACCTLA